MNVYTIISNRKRNKVKSMKSFLLKSIGTGAVVATVISLASCGEKTYPVYKETGDSRFMGSMFYANSGCISCHGAKWDGKGADAGLYAGLQATDFTTVNKSDKTPEDYFLAVTDPKGYFASRKGKVEDSVLESFSASHKILTVTDKARWQMAHFLYSLAQGSPDASKIAASEKKLAEVYASARRWEIGITPVEDRKKSPELDAVISKAGYTVAAPAQEVNVSENRVKVYLETGVASDLYKNNCASCHGNYGEGTQGSYVGLIGNMPMKTGFPRTGDAPSRQKPTGLTLKDLAGSSALSSVGAFSSAHEADATALGFASLTQEEWNQLFNYTKRLAGQ